MRVIQYNIEYNKTCEIYLDADYSTYQTLVGKEYILISSHSIYKLFPEIFENKDYILINDTDQYKNLETIEEILSALCQRNVNRQCTIIGVGGGTVCDIVGFAATIFKRGIDFGFVPTTLLSQIDAAFGGKNGVNLHGIKNIIGTFSHPKFIICDSKFIKSIPETEYTSALGEIIKYAIIDNKYNLFDFISNNIEKIKQRDSDIIDAIINKCINIKLDFIKQDPFDKGIRHLLNLGHTFGHCYEIINNLPHGIAVGYGICTATEISKKLNLIDVFSYNQIINILKNLNLFANIKISSAHANLLVNDKKTTNNGIRFITIHGIGDTQIEDFSINKLIELAE